MAKTNTKVKEKKVKNEDLVYAYQNEANKIKKDKIAKDLYLNVEKLIHKMINIVKSKFFIHQFVEEDVLSEANLIFMRCLNKFNTTKKIKFSTYLGDALYYELKRFNKKQSKHVNNNYDLEIDEIIMAKPKDVDAILDDEYSVEKIQETLLLLAKEQKITQKQLTTIIEEHGFFGVKQKSRKEMASERNCSLQNVGFLYRKALTKIKEELHNTNSR